MLYTKAMPRPGNFGGYTIVEVLIVLAITGVIFAAGVTLFRGQSQATAFEQGVQDAASEINARIKAVGSSLFFNDRSYGCNVDPNTRRAQLSTTTTTTGNQACLTLGKAFEVVTGSSDLYIYTVLGNRLKYSSSATEGPATSLAEARPTTASDPGTDLTQKYVFGNGVQVLSSQAVSRTNQNLQTSLMGYYIDFAGNASSGQNGGLAAVAEAYDYQPAGFDPANHQAAVKKCVEGSSCPAPALSSHWKLCLASSNRRRTAELVIANAATGLTIDVRFVSCG